MMQKVPFISNKEIRATDTDSYLGADPITPEGDPASFLTGIATASGDNIFVINVHCTFNGATNFQQQGGVIIYRHLLNKYRGREEKLKVIFYSPIPAKDLTALKPENFILTLLPFVELFPEDVEDWSFETALEAQIADTNFHQFNSASENLLSGWAVAGANKIDLKGKKLFIIDDEYSSWETTYSTIFNVVDILAPKYKTQGAIRAAWNNGHALNEFLAKAKGAEYILSDLYIYEDHERTKPFTNSNDIKGVSGFEVLKELKRAYPYLPYMIFTTSNKVWNVEVFRSEGIWAWAVKNKSADLDSDDKIAQFEHFQHCITKLINPEWQFVSKVWKDLIRLKLDVDSEADKTKIWWYDLCPTALAIINDCVRTLDSVYSQRATFEATYIKDFEGRQCFQLFNNLGGLCEVLKMDSDGDNRNFVGSYIYQLRNFYSHKLFYKFAKPIEAIFCIDLVLKLLMMKQTDFLQQPKRNIINDTDFVENTNLNYLLQFEAYALRSNEIRYNQIVFAALRQSFIGTKADIISDSYTKKIKKLKEGISERQSAINKNRSIIRLVDSYINRNS